MFRLWETVEDHCGYDLPWYMNPTGLIPFWGGKLTTWRTVLALCVCVLTDTTTSHLPCRRQSP